MTTAPPGAVLRWHQVRALARPATRTVPWKPLARAMVAGIAIIAVGSRVGVMSRLSFAAAVVAATTAFVLDDPAGSTLAATATSLPVRRLLRASAAVVAAGLWWFGAVALAAHRVGAVPMRALTLEFATFVAVALAASAGAARLGDRTGGGYAGAIVTLVCFASTLLPPQPWLPLAAAPTAPGATARLAAVLVIAITVLVMASRDPASPRLARRSTRPRDVVNLR